jgi:hypothetical protein
MQRLRAAMSSLVVCQPAQIHASVISKNLSVKLALINGLGAGTAAGCILQEVLLILAAAVAAALPGV